MSSRVFPFNTRHALSKRRWTHPFRRRTLPLISTSISRWSINSPPSSSSPGIRTPLARNTSEKLPFLSKTGSRSFLGDVSTPGRLPRSVRPMRCTPRAATDVVSGDPQPFDVPLASTRGNTESRGSVKVKLGFVRPQDTQLFMEFPDVYAEIVNRSRPSIVSAPPVSP